MHLHRQRLPFQQLAESCAVVWALRCLFISALLFFYAPYVWQWITQLSYPQRRNAKRSDGHVTADRSLSPLRQFSVGMLLKARQSLLKTPVDVPSAPCIHLKCVSRSAHIKQQMPNKILSSHRGTNRTTAMRSQAPEFDISQPKSFRDYTIKNVTYGDTVAHMPRGSSYHRFALQNTPKLNSLHHDEYADPLAIMISGLKGRQFAAHHQQASQSSTGCSLEYSNSTSLTDNNQNEQWQKEPLISLLSEPLPVRSLSSQQQQTASLKQTHLRSMFFYTPLQPQTSKQFPTTLPVSSTKDLFPPFNDEQNSASTSNPYQEKRKRDSISATPYSVDAPPAGSPRCLALLSDSRSIVLPLKTHPLQHELAYIRYSSPTDRVAFQPTPSRCSEMPHAVPSKQSFCATYTPGLQGVRQPSCSIAGTRFLGMNNTLPDTKIFPTPHRQERETMARGTRHIQCHTAVADIGTSSERTAVKKIAATGENDTFSTAVTELSENKKLLECVVNFRLLQRHLSLGSSTANGHSNLSQTPSSSVLPALWHLAFSASHAEDVWPDWKEVNAEIRRVLLGSIELQRKDMPGDLLRFLTARHIPIERSTMNAFESIVDTQCYNPEQEKIISQWKAAITQDASFLIPTVSHTPSQ